MAGNYNTAGYNPMTTRREFLKTVAIGVGSAALATGIEGVIRAPFAGEPKKLSENTTYKATGFYDNGELVAVVLDPVNEVLLTLTYDS
jgi:hypothetical protein